MKKIIITAIALVMLTACSDTADTPPEKDGADYRDAVTEETDTAKAPGVTSLSDEEITADNPETVTETSAEIQITETRNPETAISSETLPKTEFSVSDEELLALAYTDYSSADHISDYTFLDDMGHTPAGYESCDVVLVPIAEDIDTYAADKKNYPEFYEEETEGNGIVRKIGENELYSQWINEYTEIRMYYSNDVLTENRIGRAYRNVYPKFIRKRENSAVYTGEFTAEAIKSSFDIYYMNTPMLSREVYERDGVFVYNFYFTLMCYGDWGLDDKISLCRTETEIFPDGRVNINDYSIVKECKIPDSAKYPEWDE